MGMGSGIVLFVIGAILAFALRVKADWIDINFVGYLLMGAGVVVFLISLIVFTRRRSAAEVEPLDDRIE